MAAQGIQEAVAWLDRLAASLQDDLDAAAETALEETIHRLEGATPVGRRPDRRYPGHMVEDYRIERAGPGRFDVVNLREYARFVALEETRPHAIPHAFGYPPPFGENPDFHPGTRPSAALVAALDEEEARLEAALEVAVARMVGSVR